MCEGFKNCAPYNHRRQTQICNLHKHNIHVCGLCRGHYSNILEGSQWLCLVEVDAPNWSIMLLKAVDQRTHPVIP